MFTVYLHTHIHTSVSNVSLVTTVKPKDISHGYPFSLLLPTEICSHDGHFCTERSYVPWFDHPLHMFVLLPILYCG
jgi:hypothetical protein